MSTQKSTEGASRLVRRISLLGVWALAFGCSVGWGAFIMPGTTFLPLAGPLGTTLGIVLGALILGIIGFNYDQLMQRYPSAGGTFTYARELFGYDHAFLSSWFLFLVYLAIIWANATAIPLICRALFGNFFAFGFHYTIAGYEVWFGEILLSLAAMLLFVFACLKGSRVSITLQIALSLILLVGVVAAFVFAFEHTDVGELPNPEPFFSPDHAPLPGVFLIVFLAPWAFAGFESVSHSAEEFRFPIKKALRAMLAGLATAALAYSLLAWIAVSHQPEGTGSWVAYLERLGDFSGIDGIPVFYALNKVLGVPGLILLGAAAAGGIFTGFIGNLTAASRMIYAMGRDGLLPAPVTHLNRSGVPDRALLFLMAISLPIPFFGRAAISWIIDVNTIGIIIAYAYTSAAALKLARQEKRIGLSITGGLGVLISLFFLVYFLIPNLSEVISFSTESYLILMLWAVLGFGVFYLIFRSDKRGRLGKSTFVWVVLLLMIFFTSMIWVQGTTKNSSTQAVEDLKTAYVDEADAEAFAETLQNRFDTTTGVIIRNAVIQFTLFLVALLIIFRIYGTVRRHEQTAVEEKQIAEESSRAKTNFLSNMSHDIRTPMNAIIGYVTLAKRERMSPRMSDYLGRIEASSNHLLALINDVLEMSRIESGRMELMPVPSDLRRVMEEVRSLFATQMEEKGLHYEVSCEDVTHPRVLCDENRLNRILLNLISNAYKFTPKGGTVSVRLKETGSEDGKASFELRVKDTGIGMSPEFAAKVFEAYERERTTTVENIQGTGLGTAITKSLTEMMGGTIDVDSVQGKGTAFTVKVSFPLDPEAAQDRKAATAGSDQSEFSGLRLLLAEDNKENREVESALLRAAGFEVETAHDGQEAAEIIAASQPGDYAAVLMDIEMPEKNGYEATKLIRSLRRKELAEIPIIALSAKAFSEDIAAAYEAGMNAHLAKPLNMQTFTETLSQVLAK